LASNADAHRLSPRVALKVLFGIRLQSQTDSFFEVLQDYYFRPTLSPGASECCFATSMVRHVPPRPFRPARQYDKPWRSVSVHLRILALEVWMRRHRLSWWVRQV